MHNNTIKINLFQIKYIDYMSIKMGSVYELLKSIRKARNSPGRPGILVESTRTSPGLHQDSTRNLPGIHQESSRNTWGSGKFWDEAKKLRVLLEGNLEKLAEVRKQHSRQMANAFTDAVCSNLNIHAREFVEAQRKKNSDQLTHSLQNQIDLSASHQFPQTAAEPTASTAVSPTMTDVSTNQPPTYNAPGPVARNTPQNLPAPLAILRVSCPAFDPLWSFVGCLWRGVIVVSFGVVSRFDLSCVMVVVVVVVVVSSRLWRGVWGTGWRGGALLLWWCGGSGRRWWWLKEVVVVERRGGGERDGCWHCYVMVWPGCCVLMSCCGGRMGGRWGRWSAVDA